MKHTNNDDDDDDNVTDYSHSVQSYFLGRPNNPGLPQLKRVTKAHSKQVLCLSPLHYYLIVTVVFLRASKVSNHGLKIQRR